MRALGSNRTKYPDGFHPEDYSFDYFSEFKGKEGLVKMWQGFGGGEFAARDRAGSSHASAPADNDMERQSKPLSLLLNTCQCLASSGLAGVGYFSLDG